MKKAFENYKPKEPIKSAAYEWQQRTLDVLEYLDCPPNKKSCVFRAFRQNRSKAEAIINYMQERGIKNVFYFLKVYGQN